MLMGINVSYVWSSLWLSLCLGACSWWGDKELLWRVLSCFQSLLCIIYIIKNKDEPLS